MYITKVLTKRGSYRGSRGWEARPKETPVAHTYKPGARLFAAPRHKFSKRTLYSDYLKGLGFRV